MECTFQKVHRFACRYKCQWVKVFTEVLIAYRGNRRGFRRVEAVRSVGQVTTVGDLHTVNCLAQ